MIGTTHLSAGLFTGAALALSLHLRPVQGAAVIAGTALGSFLPDIDHRNSSISQKAKPVGAAVNAVIGHRKLLHDPALYIAAYAVLALCRRDILYTVAPLLLGVASHLLLDALNAAGIPFLYTLNKKRRIRLLRIRTGSVTDKIIGKTLHAMAYLAAGIWLFGLFTSLSAISDRFGSISLSLGG